MCTLSILRSTRRRLALKDICNIYSEVKDVYLIYSMFKGEGCTPYLFHVQVVETCIESLHLSRIYSVLKDMCFIYSTFKWEKIWVEGYLHLSRIYSEVKDVHPIYCTFKLEETYIETY
ncbi:hypothetical protein H5410_040802 [Solanum commersonii]|uniref:Uncharacterized protein n=1 Tax=Solanum commersonii TaxID=4109 RepID=A0A9J5XT00_SOLCO|nr:hypothetical protein H5410_040802 [Solanum commersonii]